MSSNTNTDNNVESDKCKEYHKDIEYLYNQCYSRRKVASPYLCWKGWYANTIHYYKCVKFNERP